MNDTRPLTTPIIPTPKPVPLALELATKQETSPTKEVVRAALGGENRPGTAKLPLQATSSALAANTAALTQTLLRLLTGTPPRQTGPLASSSPLRVESRADVYRSRVEKVNLDPDDEDEEEEEEDDEDEDDDEDSE
jgi:hypothetical protein